MSIMTQMELRILAALSGDIAMLAVFAREDEIGRDLHRATAAAMLGIRPEDVTDEQRGWGKTVNFAQAYGQSPRGLVKSMLVLCDKVISEAEAEAWRYTFRRTYPQFARWSDDQISMSNAREKIEISSGRVFDHKWGKPDAYHGNQAVNLPVQGGEPQRSTEV
jgi:DNA polymerase I